MSTPEQRLADLGIELPDPPAPAAAYQPFAVSGGLVYTAGQVPVVDGRLPVTGRLGDDLDTAAGVEQARVATVNVLAVARTAAGGDLNAVRVVKVTVFVSSHPAFGEQHLVANGASELLAEVLGDRGVHARSAVGVAALPMNAPVEVEAVLELV